MESLSTSPKELPCPLTSDSQGARPAPWRILTAPWWGVIRPRRAGQVLRDASWWMVLLNYAAILAVISVTIVALLLWNASLYFEPKTAISAETGQPYSYSYEAKQHSVSEVLADWRNRRGFSPAEITVFWVSVAVVGCALLTAWLHLPILCAHRTLGRSLGVGFRVVCGGGGVLALLVFVVALLIALGNAWQWSRYGQVAPLWNIDPRMCLPVLMPVELCLLLAWIGAAMRGAREDASDTVLSPLCEGCGYDLTHRPSDGRCTECGRSVDESLVPNQCRTGLTWQTSPDPAEFIMTTAQLFRDREAQYRQLRTHRAEALGLRFARWHYVLIGVAATAWALALGSRQRFVDWSDIAFAVTVILFVVPLAGWLTHRFVGAVVTSWWLVQGMLDRPHTVSVVHHTETPFLWVFCLFNGVLVGSFIEYDAWISQWIGGAVSRAFFGLPVEIAMLLIGNGALILWWIRRYHQSLSAVRWANY